jgi:hypothetical protein
MIAVEKQLADRFRQRQMPQFRAKWGQKGYLPFGTLGVSPIVVVLYISHSAITSWIRRVFHYNWVSGYVHSELLAKKPLSSAGPGQINM